MWRGRRCCAPRQRHNSTTPQLPINAQRSINARPPNSRFRKKREREQDVSSCSALGVLAVGYWGFVGSCGVGSCGVGSCGVDADSRTRRSRVRYDHLMEVSDVRRRLRGAIEEAKRRAAERRGRVDEASRAWADVLTATVEPAFHTLASALSGEGHRFKVLTPG